MNNAIKVIVGLFVIGAIVFVNYQIVGQWHRKQMAMALNNQRTQYEQQISRLDEQLAQLQGKLAEMEQEKIQSQPEPPTEAIENVFGQKTRVESLGGQNENCADLARQAETLFTHFDKQGYLAQAGFSTQFQPFFQESIALLAQKPPVLVAEMDDLFLLAKNVSHLYRILGLQRLNVFKTILEEENDILEPAAAVLFGWFNTCRKEEAPSPELPQLKTMYEYAVFFLNTLGGRSYLLRRGSRLRMVVNYYSVLILDLANDEKLNSVGIDIRNHIDFLMTDLSNQKGLHYRDRYLSQLTALKEKYQQTQ